jgi:hypothetical protein
MAGRSDLLLFNEFGFFLGQQTEQLCSLSRIDVAARKLPVSLYVLLADKSVHVHEACSPQKPTRLPNADNAEKFGR